MVPKRYVLEKGLANYCTLWRNTEKGLDSRVARAKNFSVGSGPWLQRPNCSH